MLDRVLAQAELMDRIMQATGVNPARTTRIGLGIGWYEASSRCTVCGDDEMPRTTCSPDAGPARGRAFLLPEQVLFELANQMEDCHESAAASLEATLETRHAKPHDRPGARRDLPR